MVLVFWTAFSAEMINCPGPMKIHVVLVEPEIPQNTGNIGRTCVAAGAVLHLVKPLGFSVEDKYLKRAGLDYWHLLDVRYYENLDYFFKINQYGDFIYTSTKVTMNYSEITYGNNVFLVFGKETRGLPESLLKKNLNRCVRIPMKQEARSLNLATAVSIIVYEVLRQHNFHSLALKGKSKLLED